MPANSSYPFLSEQQIVCMNLMCVLPVLIKICKGKSKVLTLVVRMVALKYVIHL